MNSLRIGIVGAGIVGASCALVLARRGHQVTLLDPQMPGGPHGASHGNGGWISPASTIPMSTPGLWKKIPGYLLDPMGPLTLRPASLPRLLPWLWHFVRAGSTEARVRTTSMALHQLLRDAPERHRELAHWADASHLLHHGGLLYAYPKRQDFLAEALAWQLRREQGLVWSELEGEALQAKAPALNRVYRFGIWVPAGAWCSNPGQYVSHLVAAAQRHGAQWLTTQVHRLQLQSGQCVGVHTDQGPQMLDRVIIAAGIRSPEFARQAGDRLPLASERGYHVVLPHAGLELPVPIMPSDGRMANTPTTQGLRLAGQVELAHPDAPPNWARAEVLLAHARHSYPALMDQQRTRDQTRWMGHRPSTPDGLPVIGPSPQQSGLWYACGHGHSGLASAARTALLVADGLQDSWSATDAAPWRAFGIERFQRRRFGQ
jgi:D-amino-acid dehydrogenase